MASLICHAWFKELLYQENGCVPITYGTFQNKQGRLYPPKKYWTHRSNIQYYTITLNGVLTQGQVWYAMYGSKSYCTRKMAAYQSRTVHSKTHRVYPIHTRNIGPIGPLSSTIPSPSIESLPKGRSDMPCMIQRAAVPGKWLRPNHCFWARTLFKLMVECLILDRWVKYFLCGQDRLCGSRMHRSWLRCSQFPGTVALWIMHGISDLPLGKYSIQGDGIIMDIGPMGPIFLVWIGPTLWVLECTVRDWDAAIFLVQ